MSNIDPHTLHQVMRTWLLAEDPYGMKGGGPSGRVEPPMGRPAGELAVGPHQPGEQPGLARSQGESAVERALAPGARAEPNASGASTRAFGTEAVDQAMDKAMTQQWVDRMRASKAGKKSVSGEMDKAATEGWKEKMKAGKDAKSAPPDPRVGPAGEDAVRNAMLDMNMKPLIDQTLETQRAQAIRDMIASHMAAAAENPPEMPESQIPENMNRPPGSETSLVSTHDYSLMPKFPGGQGVLNTPITSPAMPYSTSLPAPANVNRPPFKRGLKDPRNEDDIPPE